MRKLTLFIMLITTTLAVLGGMAQPVLKVVASFYIPYEFTRNVGGDRVAVKSLVPAGAEAHDFEPSAADIRALEEAQVFVYSGAGFERWVERLLQIVRNRDRLVVVEMTKGLPLRKADEEEFEYDPHVWMDPVLAKEMVRNVRDGLITADGAARAVYTENAKAYTAKLDALDAQIREGLRACRLRDFIISHRFMDYFAARYTLTVHALSGLEPSEPTPQRLAELIRLGKEKGITYIFTEKLTQLKALEALARALGAQILTLDPLEGLTEDEERAGKSYLVIMEENLQKLRIGLECP